MLKSFLTILLLFTFCPAEASILALSHTIKPTPLTRESELSSKVSLHGSRSEILNFTFRFHATPEQKCIEPKISLAPLAITPVFYEIKTFPIRRPSFRGAILGNHFDPLVEKSKFCTEPDHDLWILGELQIPPHAQPGEYRGSLSNQLPITLEIWKMSMPETPSLPLYSELTTWFLLLGHYKGSHEGEERLATKYIRSLLSHRIYPIKHWIRPLPWNESTNSISIDSSFKSQVIDPLPPAAMISIPLPSPLPSPNRLSRFASALRRALLEEGFIEPHLKSRFFFYLWDEPHSKDFPTLLKSAEVLKKNIPEVQILVTTTYRKELAAFVDVFAPVMDQFDRSGFPPVNVYNRFWLYVSCMSHGCSNDVSSGSPDWVIDRPSTAIRSQAWIAAHYGSSALLYYSVNNGYQKAPLGRDLWNELFDFTGNGDGTLYYPGVDEPVESLRLKLWRQASYDHQYITWMNEWVKNAKLEKTKKLPIWWDAAARDIARSTRQWESRYQPYNELRTRAGQFLNANFIQRSQNADQSSGNDFSHRRLRFHWNTPCKKTAHTRASNHCT